MEGDIGDGCHHNDETNRQSNHSQQGKTINFILSIHNSRLNISLNRLF